MSEIVLHNYFRSSTSYRVRIALAMKGLPYRYVAHHLRHGEQNSPAYLAVNPQGLVPALVWSDGTMIAQSMAIMEFLEEMVPEPRLLPADPHGRARVRMLSQMIACEIHPVNNLRVLGALRQRYHADDAEVASWFRHWVAATFGPLEALLSQSPDTGTFCHGETPGMADICLVAQVANNRRFDVDMTPYPAITRINEACMKLQPFIDAAPANQPDAE
ncbi:maleylacetoacetate isomerase [Nitratireductor indicus]|uniref:Maleylacetoacetate isomerase n=1 Tax=Nitratireductor indicus C115 TaxID=1231190 RepID=K2PS09_9HYPH|nr:maleylacetoacetate isomerase [Nitratireductor indicus]EKF43867.1 maleylacetoacetate isomerase [Nitratireductor indicus C115]MDS1135458.1 maleylacetoacetate isomerase [Nitratireductor indicus]SFQ15219.1 maleylpyruvate isomerase [Nitratireductor indicus]